jgi:hypothetical protein
MVAVANAAGIWQSFGYNFDDPNGNIKELSDETKSHLESMPPFIKSWQAQDIANNDFGGYYQNPVGSVASLIYQTASHIVVSTTGVTNLSNVHTSATGLVANADNFRTHTARLSGLIENNGTDTQNVYMEQAMSLGRTAMYITNQTDGITNNAPILGSFSSIMIEPQLTANSDILLTYKEQLNGSINVSLSFSNLTSSQITTIDNHINSLNDFMNYRRTSDINFYTNVKVFVDGYNKTKKLNNMGESEKYLMNNFIGTEKAKNRINNS